jgi:hypothetical protein
VGSLAGGGLMLRFQSVHGHGVRLGGRWVTPWVLPLGCEVKQPLGWYADNRRRQA